jgi:tetratricopeptide (TPR) repeat protein
VPLIPVLIGISVFQWNDYVHDRYLYLPSVMAAILLAVAIKELNIRLTSSGRLQKTVVLASAIAVAFGVGTILQSGQWESDLALFSHAHERAPNNPLPFDYMARSLYGDGQVDAALRQYEELLKNRPDYWQGNYVLGLAYYQLGRYEESEKYLTTATKVWPREFLRPEPAQFYYLGLVQQRKNEYAAAERSLRQAIALRPEAPGYRLALAQVLKQQGAVAEAEEQLRWDAANRKAFEARQKGIPQIN